MSEPVVYIKRITNLSDARYGAGMGADMLGFAITPGQPDYVDPKLYQEIMGWVSGPLRVVEIDHWEKMDLEEINSRYAPDLLHIPLRTASLKNLPDFPLILDVEISRLTKIRQELAGIPSQVRYLAVPYEPALANLGNQQDHSIPLLVILGEEIVSLPAADTTGGAKGYILQGSHELKPGLKDYDHLASLLEAIRL